MTVEREDTTVKPRPLKKGEFRKNKDGTRSTQLLAGFNIDGKEVNIPLIWYTSEGIKQVSGRKAVKYAKDFEKRTGKKFRSYDSPEEAKDAAIKSSEKGGTFAGPPYKKDGGKVYKNKTRRANYK